MNVNYRPASELVELNRSMGIATVWSSSLLLRQLRDWMPLVNPLHSKILSEVRTTVDRQGRTSLTAHKQVAAVMFNYLDDDRFDQKYLAEAIDQADEIEKYGAELLKEIEDDSLSGNVKFVKSLKEVRKT